MAGTREVPSGSRRSERMGAHTHTEVLGLDDNLKAVRVKDGMAGQEKAREAAGLVVQLIREGKMRRKSPISGTELRK